MVDRAALRARCEAASPGPWTPYDANEGNGWPPRPFWAVQNEASRLGLGEDDGCVDIRVHTGDQYDADFIAHARTDLPALLDALDAAEARVRQLEAAARWALGEDSDIPFPSRPDKVEGKPQPLYWWRSTFRRLAFPEATP